MLSAVIVLFFAGTYGSFIFCGWNCSLQEFCQGWWHSVNWYFSINQLSQFSLGLCFHNSLFSDDSLAAFLLCIQEATTDTSIHAGNMLLNTQLESLITGVTSAEGNVTGPRMCMLVCLCQDVPQDPHPLCFCLFPLILRLIRAPQKQKCKTEMINYGQIEHRYLLLLLMPILLDFQLPLS